MTTRNEERTSRPTLAAIEDARRWAHDEEPEAMRREQPFAAMVRSTGRSYGRALLSEIDALRTELTTVGIDRELAHALLRKGMTLDASGDVYLDTAMRAVLRDLATKRGAE